MSPTTLLSLGISISFVFIFWTFSATTSSPFARNFPRLYNKRICLLIAHPDDEAMFFAPTVLSLTRPALGNHLKILCLSSGNADGLGETRKKELVKSALRLGVRSESDVYVVDDPSRFPDSMTAEWSESDISNLLTYAFAPENNTSSSNQSLRKRSSKNSNDHNNTPPTATIDVLLTFDSHGISNHPNHRSLYHGAVHFVRSLMKGKDGYTCPITLYTLSTTNLLRKYMGVLDAPLSMAKGALSALFASRDGSSSPARLLFVSDVREWMFAQEAMVKAHRSQMVWFRYGWITLGRYMVVNDLKRERI
ncbi:N-acetylglucosaminyl phosphatidylinositol de-N-acetylase [Aspergillus campestris IBT 28561]|uniref:N-acetylglucosaminylphosphatidylinositol deacetylase n=1 Tax=Aspergillus campestris (strain IBT 28561) TaxID=1392248 RepID=A0A2I1D113_ASPC2|nr:N-acetylglucosaminyl phosphatidylinositol de-N-acetylase [Aspergillus campestris IBT 28561]PKY03560.1 N-acetylglucosaminyl phosphatidylinositol de-N-acetylase [Aspergillus campestris IBT 28561]